MRAMRRRLWVLRLAGILLLSACVDRPSQAEPGSFNPDSVFLNVRGEDIRVRELPFQAQREIFAIERQRFEALRQVAERLRSLRFYEASASHFATALGGDVVDVTVTVDAGPDGLTFTTRESRAQAA